MKTRKIAVTGIGIVSPVGHDRESSWKATVEGESGVDIISIFDVSKFPCKIAGEVKGYCINKYLPPKHNRLQKYISRGASFGIGASIEAMEDAGLSKEDFDKTRLGVSFGNSGQRALLYKWKYVQQALKDNFNDMPFISVSEFLKCKYHTCAELVSIIHGAEAFNYSISTACASGTQAIGLGYRMIQENQADVVIAGGCDSMINEIDLMSFCLLGAVTIDFNSEPMMASCPFSKNRSGFVLGEGGAVLILEELDHALERKAHIYGLISGYGSSMSAYSMTDPPPDGSGAYSAMKNALKDGNVKISTIEYINAHGTSTRDNDYTETLSIKKLYGKSAYNIPISSTKSTTAHLISGAGAIEAAFCLLSIRDGVLPPTINLKEADGNCDLDYIPNYKRLTKIKCAMSNSLGFGGTNATVILSGY